MEAEKVVWLVTFEALWHCLVELKLHLPYHPAIPLLGIYCEICLQMCIGDPRRIKYNQYRCNKPN